MNKDQVVKHYGSVRAAAEALGVSTQAIYTWEDGIPHRSQLLIQALTEGKLKVDKRSGRK